MLMLRSTWSEDSARLNESYVWPSDLEEARLQRNDWVEAEAEVGQSNWPQSHHDDDM